MSGTTVQQLTPHHHPTPPQQLAGLPYITQPVSSIPYFSIHYRLIIPDFVSIQPLLKCCGVFPYYRTGQLFRTCQIHTYLFEPTQQRCKQNFRRVHCESSPSCSIIDLAQAIKIELLLFLVSDYIHCTYSTCQSSTHHFQWNLLTQASNMK